MAHFFIELLERYLIPCCKAFYYHFLGHPKVRAFISHGGLLGIMESVHCGVPIMVMPQFGDQHTNAKAVESVGGGVILYLNEADEESIYQSLKKILEPR